MNSQIGQWNSEMFCCSVTSRVWLFVTLQTAACQASLSLTISQSLCSSPRVHVHCRGDVIQPSHLLKPSSPSAIDVSQHQGLFQWVVMWIRWPKYWCFTFSISPSSEYSRLISLKIDWIALLAVQGTFRSVLQHHSWKTSILGRSDFSVVQKMLCTGQQITSCPETPTLAPQML